MSEQATLLEFPCPFSVKSLSKNSPEIATRIVDLVCQHVPNLNFSAVKTRPSRTGKYIAVTIVIEATSKTQLDAIYQDLSDCNEVIMAL